MEFIGMFMMYLFKKMSYVHWFISCHHQMGSYAQLPYRHFAFYKEINLIKVAYFLMSHTTQNFRTVH